MISLFIFIWALKGWCATYADTGRFCVTSSAFANSQIRTILASYAGLHRKNIVYMQERCSLAPDLYDVGASLLDMAYLVRAKISRVWRASFLLQ